MAPSAVNSYCLFGLRLRCFISTIITCSREQNSIPCTDGGMPEAALIQGSDGNFYGDTNAGGNGDPAANSGASGGVAFKPACVSHARRADPVVTLQLANCAGQSGYALLNVFPALSTTQQQCYAFVQGGATGAGTWTGQQIGTLSAATCSRSCVYYADC